MDLLQDEGMLSAGDPKIGLEPKGSQAWISQYMYSLGIAVAGGRVRP